MRITVRLSARGAIQIKVSSNGRLLLNRSVPADRCTAPPTPTPTATATLSCAAGGVELTLANASTATADASFVVNGSSYGPLAPGASQTVTVPVAPGSSIALTVTSAGRRLIGGTVYKNTCSASPTAQAQVVCTPAPNPMGGAPGGGTLTIDLTNGPAATLTAPFTVTVAGNTAAGYGPQDAAVASGSTQTLSMPIDSSGNEIEVTVSSGGTQIYSQTFSSGCPFLPPEG